MIWYKHLESWMQQMTMMLQMWGCWVRPPIGAAMAQKNRMMKAIAIGTSAHTGPKCVREEVSALAAAVLWV